ncbi:hypothetical protein ACQUQQ_08335 [Acidithiobacillus ferrooxidans]|uniref:hypothetical protein n=1 Tax=Acidithiobacillus ferrooxidans TaxID=920 RepID=UPI003D1858C2
MTTLAINSVFNEARTIWFAPGCEDSRGEAIDWLKTQTSKVPMLIQTIAKEVGITVPQAITLSEVIEGKDGARLGRSRVFKSLPITALDIWHEAGKLYQSNLHKSDSSGAAHKKLMDGQYLKGIYKPGLLATFDGDAFQAHTAYYLAHGGMRAVRAIQRCMGWTADKIREMALIVVNASHQLINKIGKRGLKLLIAAASAGLGFFPMLFSILQGKVKAKTEQTSGSAKKVAKAAKKIVTAKGAKGEDDTDEEDDTDLPGVDVIDGPGDDDSDRSDHVADGEASITDHVPADGPPIRSAGDEFDDPDADDDPDDSENQDPDLHAKLKMGRELAYELLRQARRNAASQHQRYRDLMDAIDDRILLNALQKGLRPTDLAVAERMTNFLSFCWQWAERKGVFLEKSHQKKNSLDMPAAQIMRQIIHAVQNGYWEVGDNQPVNNAKVWIDVIHEDRNGRRRIAALTRPISPQLEAKPYDDTKGRMIVINPDHAALREYFFQNIQDQNTWPREKNTRYFIVSTDKYETITAQRFIRPRSNALTNATSLDDLENTGQAVQAVNADDGVAPAFDFPGDDEETIQMVAAEIGVDKNIVGRILAGDSRAQEMLAHTCRALPETRKTAIEAKFSGESEAKIDDATAVSPSRLDQKTRRDLAHLLNLNLETLEKAFQDHPDAVKALKRAIRAMPERDRGEAIRRIELAATSG